MQLVLASAGTQVGGLVAVLDLLAAPVLEVGLLALPAHHDRQPYRQHQHDRGDDEPHQVLSGMVFVHLWACTAALPNRDAGRS